MGGGVQGDFLCGMALLWKGRVFSVSGVSVHTAHPHPHASKPVLTQLLPRGCTCARTRRCPDRACGGAVHREATGYPGLGAGNVQDLPAPRRVEGCGPLVGLLQGASTAARGGVGMTARRRRVRTRVGAGEGVGRDAMGWGLRCGKQAFCAAARRAAASRAHVRVVARLCEGRACDLFVRESPPAFVNAPVRPVFSLVVLRSPGSTTWCWRLI